MPAQHPPSPSHRIATVELSIRGRPVRMEMAVPTRLIRPEDMLPLFRKIAEGLLALAVAEAANAGRHVSCKPACGACCRQLVPISPAEARHITALIDRQPQPAQTRLRQRFSDARLKLQQAALLQSLLQPSPMTKEDRHEFGRRYFALHIPCPFLENESCSIHPDRPIPCREYVVTSDPAHCASLDPQLIQALPPPAGPIWRAVAALDQAPAAQSVPWAPLILAPDCAAHYPPPAPRPGTDIFADFLHHLAPSAPSTPNP